MERMGYQQPEAPAGTHVGFQGSEVEGAERFRAFCVRTRAGDGRGLSEDADHEASAMSKPITADVSHAFQALERDAGSDIAHSVYQLIKAVIVEQSLQDEQGPQVWNAIQSGGSQHDPVRVVGNEVFIDYAPGMCWIQRRSQRSGREPPMQPYEEVILWLAGRLSP